MNQILFYHIGKLYYKDRASWSEASVVPGGEKASSKGGLDTLKMLR